MVLTCLVLVVGVLFVIRAIVSSFTLASSSTNSSKEASTTDSSTLAIQASSSFPSTPSSPSNSSKEVSFGSFLVRLSCSTCFAGSRDSSIPSFDRFDPFGTCLTFGSLASCSFHLVRKIGGTVTSC